MLSSATLFTAPQLLGVAVAAIGGFLLARRDWTWTVTAVVLASCLSWSWIDWVKQAGNIVYWGLVVALGASMILLARQSVVARALVVLDIVAGCLLATTAAWSIAPHTSLVETGKFGGVLLVASYAALRVREEGAAKLVRATALLTPTLILLSLAVLLGWRAARAEGGGASGFFAGPNILAMVLALVLPCTLCHPAVQTFARRVAVIAAVTFTCALSAGRAGLAGAVVALCVLALWERSPRLFVGGLTAVVALTAAAIVWAPNIPTLGAPLQANPTTPQSEQLLLGSRPSDQSRLSAFLGARDEAWREAVRVFPKRALQGTGFGTGSDIFAHYGSRKHFHYFIGAFENTANVHNAYLQDFLELGLFGGVLFFSPVALALFAAARGLWRRAGTEPAFAALLFAAAAEAIFESLFSELGPLTLLTWLGVAVVLACASRNYTRPT
jgi:O-antigen ligase